jgi:porphobilinogen synthase
MPFPQTRLRRLRATRALRGLVRETNLTPSDFVYPMFVAHGIDRREPIEAMPGVDRLSIAHAVAEAGEAAELGIPAVLLFGLPAAKDEEGSGAWDDEGIVQLATRAIKEAHPDLITAGWCAGTARSTTTRPLSCWHARPRRRPAPVPTSSLRAT